MTQAVPTIGTGDVEWILELNKAAQTETSLLDADALQALLSASWRATACGRDAFLIALDQDGDSGGVNFRWFRARHSRFIYVDRIITRVSSRGRGLARLLYEDLFEAGRQHGHAMIGCEVNIDPPNPSSLSFHDKLGFRAVGSAHLPSGKTVRYLTCVI